MRTEYGERSGKIVTARLPFFRLEVSVVLALARDGRPAFELDAENGRCVTESESGTEAGSAWISFYRGPLGLWFGLG